MGTVQCCPVCGKRVCECFDWMTEDVPILPHAADNPKPTDKEAGTELAQIGAQVYFLMDRRPDLESDEEMQRMMYLLNKISRRLILGQERADEPEVPLP